ncbi:hypothetical protein HPB49_022012 [Dermacentor silvarum]|uniref:Uncharacterized protein n=1 Tax=Dermacentor silvarum TaxID=543639 RepID=A0ACB8CBD8_DERSI|nr:hypothetical protein HPB49_022012 [Dermacentor silvarum]
MSLFGKKASPAEQMRQQNRELRKTERDIERDRRQLERQEKQLELEIKKAANQGNKQVCTVLAKQLVQLRKQKARTYAASSKVQAIGSQSKLMNANVKLANAMATTAKTMGEVNKQIKPQDIAKTMQDFEKESTKMGMTEELGKYFEDTLNSILDESGDEEEQDAIVNKVLDEIGIEMSGKLATAPSARSDPLGESSKARLPTDDEIERQLAKLKT